MSSPSDPQPPADPRAPAQPSTQEIPVVAPAAAAHPLPPHPGATTPAPVQTARSTGPLDFVPGFSGPPPPTPPAPTPPATAPPVAAVSAAAPQPTPAQGAGATPVWPDSLETGPVPFADPARPAGKAPALRDRTALLGVGLVLAALVLLQLGLSRSFGGESFWSDIPLWSAFATVCVVLGLAGFASLVPGGRRLSGETGWRVAAGGLVGLAVFWLLVVLPVVAGDRGFLLTAALGCFGAALWTGPARRR